MANYISTEILAEAYSHLEIEVFNDKAKLEALRRELTSFFQERASFFFGGDVEIKVVFEEGSLKTRVIAIGSVAATLLTAVGAYGGFRDGVVQLANDAATLAQSANMEVVFRTRTAQCDRLRIEKRKGVFGRVAALLYELDNVASSLSSTRLPTTHIRLKDTTVTIDALLKWDSNVDRLFEKFEGPETEACVAQGLLDEVRRLPRSVPWLEELNQGGFRVDVTRSDPNLAGQIDATAARYAATIKALEKKLRDRLIIATK